MPPGKPASECPHLAQEEHHALHHLLRSAQASQRNGLLGHRRQRVKQEGNSWLIKQLGARVQPRKVRWDIDFILLHLAWRKRSDQKVWAAPTSALPLRLDHWNSTAWSHEGRSKGWLVGLQKAGICHELRRY